MHSPQMTGSLGFKLLGQALLTHTGPATFRITSQKGLALLIFLAMHAGRAVERSALAALLWSDRAEAQARQNLRQTVFTLRRELGPAHAEMLRADDQSLSLLIDPADVDALQFEKWSSAKDAASRDRCLGMAWGSFLGRFSVGSEAFDEWAAAERTRLDALAIRTFAELALRHDAAGDPERAIQALERLIAVDPSDEERHRWLLTLEARHRGTDAALARAKELAAMLEREFDAKPEVATRTLIEQLRQKRDRPPDGNGKEQAVPHLASGGVSEAAGSEPPASTGRPAMAKRWRAAIAAAALMASLAIGLFIMAPLAPQQHAETSPAPTGGPQTPGQSPVAPSQPGPPVGRFARGVTPVAILPFTAYGAPEGRERLFAEMLTDDLTLDLSRIPGLRVIARQTMRTYQGQSIDAVRIGTELNVRYLLEGSVRLESDVLRVNVALVDASNGLHLWNGRYQQTLADRQNLRAEIVARLARELQVEIYKTEGGRTEADNPDIATLIYHGWSALFTQSREGREALTRAEDAFRQALALAPRQPRAMTGLAAVLITRAVQLYDRNGDNHLDEAEALLDDVIARGLDSVGAHHFRAIAYQRRGRIEDAIRSFERALELTPSSASTYAHLGYGLLYAGRMDEAMEHIRYAMQLSPRDPVLPLWQYFEASVEVARGNDAAALSVLARAAALAPRNIRILGTLAAVYALSDNPVEARKLIATVREIAPHLTDQRLIQSLSGGGNANLARIAAGLRLALAPSWESPRLGPAPASERVGRDRGVVAMAVLPFSNGLAPDNASAIVADMVTEDLTSALSRIPVLRIISRHSTIAYVNNGRETASIGEALGVRYVLEGSAWTQGELLRINLTLHDAILHKPLWSGRFERNGADRFAVQDQIVNSIARELWLEVVQVESQRDSADFGVHELIFRGRAAITMAMSKGVDALYQAENYFNQALARDPGNIQALIGRAGFHAQMAVQLFASDPKPHIEAAEKILLSLIERHPSLSDPYHPLGLLHVARGRWAEAVQVFTKLIELNPSHALAHAQIGRALTRLGHPREGREHIVYAMRLSPNDPSMAIWLGFAGHAALEMGRHDDAIRYLDQAQTLNPGQPRTTMVQIAAYALSGRINEARAILNALQKRLPHLSHAALLKRFSRNPAPDTSQLSDGMRLALSANGN